MKFYLIPTFKKSKSKVVCHLMVTIRFNDNLINKISFVVKGKSKCHPEDTFDFEVGKRLAESRACKVAHKKLKSLMEKLYKDTINLHDDLASGLKKLSKMTDDENNHYEYLIQK